jgi:hypothetical protein
MTDDDLRLGFLVLIAYVPLYYMLCLCRKIIHIKSCAISSPSQFPRAVSKKVLNVVIDFLKIF